MDERSKREIEGREEVIDQQKKEWLKEIGAEEIPGEDRYSYTFDGFENEKLKNIDAALYALHVEDEMGREWECEKEQTG